MESRKSKGRSRKEKFAYPWAMAPMINMRKPVATAIATFVSIDRFVIFPSIMAAPPSPPVFLDFVYLTSLRISACLWTPGAARALAPREKRGKKKEKARRHADVASSMFDGRRLRFDLAEQSENYM